MGLPYDENVDIIDRNHIGASNTGYTLPPGYYEIVDLNLMLIFFKSQWGEKDQ